MPRAYNVLTDRKIGELTERGYYGDGRNLYLQVAKGGSKSWVLRYQIEGRRRDMGLGGWPLFKVADARKRAEDARRKAADKIDPLAGRRQRGSRSTPPESGSTFKAMTKGFIDAKRAGWGAKKAHDWQRSMELHVLPAFGDLPVDQITAAMVADLLRPIWTDKPTQASLVQQRIAGVLDYAGVHGHRSGDNPARWKGNLEFLLSGAARGETAHHKALPYADVPAFMSKLGNTLADNAVRLMILTAARSAEVRGCRWSQLDLERALWTIPGDAMKGGRTHIVPLSGDALAILRSIERGDDDRVFPLRERAIYEAVVQHQPGITAHGFRSTFRTWGQEATEFPADVLEHCLAHITGDASERAYKRGDAIEKRRQVMEAWADHCDPIPTEW